MLYNQIKFWDLQRASDSHLPIPKGVKGIKMCKDSRILKKCTCGGKKIVPQTKKVSAMFDVPRTAGDKSHFRYIGTVFAFTHASEMSRTWTQDSRPNI